MDRQRRPHRARRAPRARAPVLGFTLVELVLVLAMVGLLGAIAAPRFFARREVDERLFADEVTAVLRHARRVAVSSGCTVEARFDGGAVRLAQQTACAGAVFDAPVIDPGDGSAQTRRTAPNGVALASDVDPLRFDALGRAQDGAGVVRDARITIGARALLVAGETGFLRAP